MVFLECLEGVLRVSGECLESVCSLSSKCLDGCLVSDWKVFGGCMKRVSCKIYFSIHFFGLKGQVGFRQVWSVHVLTCQNGIFLTKKFWI